MVFKHSIKQHLPWYFRGYVPVTPTKFAVLVALVAGILLLQVSTSGDKSFNVWSSAFRSLTPTLNTTRQGPNHVTKLTGQYKRRAPRSIIMGVMKGGTYALRTFLTLHPRIMSPNGEVNYFSRYYRRGPRWYIRHMPPSYSNQITIEKSLYFGNMYVQKRIWRFNPKMKFLLVVRDPVTRALSHFSHMRHLGFIRRSTKFKDIVLSGDVINTEENVVRAGLYRAHLMDWYQVFPRNQIHIVDGDSFIKNPIPELKKVEDFLGLENYLSEENLYYDRSKGFYCLRRKNFKRCLPPGKGRDHPEVDSDVIHKLQDFYHPHNLAFFREVNQTFNWTSEQDWARRHFVNVTAPSVNHS